MAKSLQAATDLQSDDVSQAILNLLEPNTLTKRLWISFVNLKGKGWGKMEGYMDTDSASGFVMLSRSYLDFLQQSKERPCMFSSPTEG